MHAQPHIPVLNGDSSTGSLDPQQLSFEPACHDRPRVPVPGSLVCFHQVQGCGPTGDRTFVHSCTPQPACFTTWGLHPTTFQNSFTLPPVICMSSERMRWHANIINEGYAHIGITTHGKRASGPQHTTSLAFIACQKKRAVCRTQCLPRPYLECQLVVLCRLGYCRVMCIEIVGIKKPGCRIL